MIEECSFVEFVQVWLQEQKVGRKPDFSIPAMHEEIAAWLDTTKDAFSHRLLMAYRHSGKSYLVGLYVCWRLMLDPNYTAVVISAGSDLAKQNTTFMKQVIEQHPFCYHLRPQPQEGDRRPQERGPTVEWQKTQFRVRRDTVSNVPSVKCRSILSKITGFHGAECILDDAETSDNIHTEENRLKIKKALEEINSMVDRVLAIGTPHHEDSIYKQMVGPLAYNLLFLPVYLADGVTPRNLDMGHNEAWIESKRKNTSDGKFRSQWLLEFVKAYQSKYNGNLLIPFKGKIAVTSEPGERRPIFWIDFDEENSVELVDIRAYYDPAYGETTGDDSTIAVVGKSVNGRVYVIADVILPPIDFGSDHPMWAQFDVMLDVLRRCHCNTVYAEINFSPTLAADLRFFCKERNAMIRVMQRRRTSNMRKEAVIGGTLDPLMKTGNLYIHESCYWDFKMQLEEFPSSRAKDDLIDAAAGAILELSGTRVDMNGVADASTTSLHRVGGGRVEYEPGRYTNNFQPGAPR